MIFRGTTPDVDIPDREFTGFVLDRARDLAAKPALIDAASGHTLTYGQLATAVDAVAAGFAARGLRKRDVVAIDAPNLPEYVVAFLGVVRAGGIVTTISPLFTANELGKQLADSGARFLVTIPQLLDKAATASSLSNIEEVFVIGEAADGATAFADVLSTHPPPAIDVDPRNDVVVLPYSSGTTGMPKGVMLTHRNLVANLRQILAVDGIEEDDVVAGVLPFFHIYGMVVIMAGALNSGATIVTMPRFDLDAFLDSIQKYRITRANLVPPIILALAKHPAVDRYDLSSLDWITSGAAPLGADVQKTCADRIDCIVRQGYGLTETSPVTHCVPKPPAPQRPGSVGPPLPNTEVCIANLVTNARLGPNEEGEVWIRGPQVMKGYFDNDAATNAMITNDGWLRTGDIGRCDDDGYLFIVDRAKELIKYKGFQVAPAELEATLLSHPEIEDAAVIGVQDEEAGEVPKAFVVRRGQLSETDVIDFVAEHVAAYKKIRYVEFRDAIPKSPSGKLLRRVLLNEERAGHQPPRRPSMHPDASPPSLPFNPTPPSSPTS